MKNAIRIISALLLLVQLTGCVTRSLVEFQTSEENAEIIIDGQYMGSTPFNLKMSNAIWEDPTIIVKKEGFHDVNYHLKKEIKAVNLIFGILIFWPFLWASGPSEYQYIEMYAKGK